MALRRIEQIKISPMGHLLVRPAPADGAMDALIYRAGNGVGWDPKESAFRASEPHRWEHAELLQHIIRTMADECGDFLQVSDSTLWTNISEQQVVALRLAASQGAPDV